MNGSSKIKRQHIDDVQAATVDEHFKLILNDETLIDPDSSIVTPDDLPDWYDSKMYKQGKDFYNRYLFGILVNEGIGLIAAYAIPQILKVLTYTKQSSTICSAFKRYIQTLLHLHKFYTSDPDDADSDWYRSMNVVRWKHKTSSKKCNNAGIGGIYQKNMVFIQFSFMGYAITMPETFGILMTPEDREAFNHLWRVIGHMLGIPDRLNLCRKTVAETHTLCQKIIHMYADHLKDTPSEFHDFSKITLRALWYFDLSVNNDSIMSLVYKIHGHKYKKPIGWYSWLNMKFRSTILNLCLIPYFGVVLRTCINNLIKFIFWYSENYGALYAWLKYPSENLQLNLYPKYT